MGVADLEQAVVQMLLIRRERRLPDGCTRRKIGKRAGRASGIASTASGIKSGR